MEKKKEEERRKKENVSVFMETALTGKQLKTEHMCTCIFMCGVSNKYNKAIKNVKKS